MTLGALIWSSKLEVQAQFRGTVYTALPTTCVCRGILPECSLKDQGLFDRLYRLEFENKSSFQDRSTIQSE